MSKFSEWLDAEWGRSSALLRYLESRGRRVHKNQLSRWKNGVHPVPSDLFEPIVKFSKRALHWTDLLPSATQS